MHRVGQLVAHVRARVRADEEAFARRVLPERAWHLFAAMPVADRRHGLNVAHRLLEGGHDSTELLAAALLHDAGKGRRMRLWHRVAGVLLEALAPRLLGRLATADPRSPGHGFWLYLHHGRISAELAVGAGCSPLTGRLIHGVAADEAGARLLAALKAADDAS